MDGIRFMRYHIFGTKYEKENRAEEAAIVTKIISKEEANEIREYDDD